jgi:hypothetical protein
MDTVAAIFSGIVTAYLLFSVIFESNEEFIECVKFWFTPDIFSNFKRQFYENHWAEFKIFIWVGCSVSIGYGVHSLFQ